MCKPDKLLISDATHLPFNSGNNPARGIPPGKLALGGEFSL